MRAIVRGVHLPLTSALREYVTKHLVQPLARVPLNDATEVDVQLCEAVGSRGPKGGPEKECRVTVFLPGTRTLRVVERGGDLYACISAARDRVERAAKRQLDRMRRPTAHAVGRPLARARRVIRH